MQAVSEEPPVPGRQGVMRVRVRALGSSETAVPMRLFELQRRDVLHKRARAGSPVEVLDGVLMPVRGLALTRDLIAAHGGASFVAETEDAVAFGMVSLVLAPFKVDPARPFDLVWHADGAAPEPGAAGATLLSLWVDADMRGRGVGRALAVQALAYARHHHAASVAIQVDGTDPRLSRFYAALGFVSLSDA